MVMTGINQGMQPLISFSYGQNHEKNVRTYHKYARIMVCICSVFLFGMVEIFARPITNAFLDINNVNFIDTVRALRLFCIVVLRFHEKKVGKSGGMWGKFLIFASEFNRLVYTCDF